VSVDHPLAHEQNKSLIHRPYFLQPYARLRSLAFPDLTIGFLCGIHLFTSAISADDWYSWMFKKRFGTADTAGARDASTPGARLSLGMSLRMAIFSRWASHSGSLNLDPAEIRVFLKHIFTFNS
jgi:hypothetical protein